ncbi:peptidoglycan D,D-transpeptidase FtsI family protein [Schaalia sp. lx-100]|uniref:peptidoglycan D,D-transpeptidase FtsI family protein n=1 Tax=Schaalia sp. lx-100 TaxID=2899081 RepID=UPI001E65BE46|nr:penicillin-binding protein 2 [Schaalia sp. lx-100]
MNNQLRKLFVVVLLMFCALGLAVTHNHVLRAPQLNADSRNARSILHAAETDRGPIIVDGIAVASSSKIEDTRRYQRTYSEGPLYAPVTGYFSSTFSQSTGIEAAASQVLSGDSSALLIQRIRNLFTGNTRQGGGVALTLDPQLQRIAAEKLGSRKGAVVALDAQTGAIRALYSSPSYDPNTLAVQDGAAAEAAYEALVTDPSRPLYNRAIAGDLYRPGSSFKVLTTIALLQKGVAQPDTHMDSPTEATLPTTRTSIENYGHSACGNGNPTLAEAFARSCNTTFVLASASLTHDDLAGLTQKFGFGDSLEIPLKVTPSIFPEKTDPAQLALTTIGQFDVKVTPLQMAQIAQAIANNGEMMKPYLINEILDADLQTQSKTSPTSLGAPISAEVAHALTRMMRDVVEAPYGTARSLLGLPFPIAVKTGTAENGDEHKRTTASVMGFAPADNPQIAFAIFVEGDDADPQPTGESAAGPILRALLEAGIK